MDKRLLYRWVSLRTFVRYLGNSRYGSFDDEGSCEGGGVDGIGKRACRQWAGFGE